MVNAKNYETTSAFVKVMQKKLWPLFFPDTVYYLLIEMWKCSLQQVGHELLHIGHVLYGGDVRSQWYSYPVHFHQTEHVRQDGRVHHQTYTAME